MAEIASYSATACTVHHVSDLRGSYAIALPVPSCDGFGNNQYGAWSEGAGGFIFAAGCAMESANFAAEQLDEDPDDTVKILAVCSEHEEQPADRCEECFADDDEDEA